MDQSHIAQAADFLWRTRIEQRRIEALPDHLRPNTLAEGYAIQDAMVPSAAQPVSGWKVAATSKAGQAHIGVTEPLAGRLFKNFILEDGARLPAAPLHMKVMEAEFAFRMARGQTGHTEASYKVAGSRKELAKDAVFGPAFVACKSKISTLDLRFVEEIDPTRQALLEIYAATVLKTPYNDFDTH